MSAKQKGGNGSGAPGSSPAGGAYKGGPKGPAMQTMRLQITSDDNFSLALTTSESATASEVIQDFCTMRKHLQPLECPDVEPGACTLAFPTGVRKSKSAATAYEYLGQNAVLSSVLKSAAGAGTGAAGKRYACVCLCL
jgi:hypothetical protein